MNAHRKRFVTTALALISLVPAPATLYGAEQPFTVLVRFYPAAGREAELESRLTKLRDFVLKNNPGVVYKLHRSEQEPVVFLLYEIFPSQAAFDAMATKIFPAFQKENGPIPEGIVRRPVEREIFRALTD